MTRPPVPAFTVEIDDTSLPIIIRMSGEFDLTKVEHFEASLESLPENGDIVVDLGSTSLIDSAGLGAILRLCRDRRQTEAAVVVRAPRPFQRRLFEVTGLAHLLDPNDRDVGP